MWPLAVLTGDRKEMFGRFAGLKKMGVISRLPYYRGGLWAWFLCINIINCHGSLSTEKPDGCWY